MITCKSCKYMRKTVSTEDETTGIACIAHINEKNGKVLLLTLVEGICMKWEVAE